MNANGPDRQRFGEGRRLKSWKEIAAFFGADERTVKRWEAKRGLPVRRIPGARATVYADAAELERWLSLSGAAPAAEPGPAPRFRRPLAAAGAFLALLLLAGLGLGLRHPAGASARPVHNVAPAVADLYLAGLYNFERRSPESLGRARALFGAAIARDPDYADAYAGLANTWLLLREYAGIPDSEAYPRAREAADRALALDASSADGQAARAFVTFYWERDFDEGLAGFRRAIALDPRSARAHHWYATALFHAGRSGEALDQIDQAQRLEPQSHAVLADKGLILSANGRGAEAIALLRQIEASEPEYMSPHAYLAIILLAARDYPAFLAEERIAARLLGDSSRAEIAETAARGLARGGPPAMLRAMLLCQRRLYAAGRIHAYGLAATYALAGDRDAAMKTLALSIRNREPDLVSLREDGRFATLRASAEFRRLAVDVGRAG
jgi:cytochrome c-type biogenesis protein CcmH/NrfG